LLRSRFVKQLLFETLDSTTTPTYPLLETFLQPSAAGDATNRNRLAAALARIYKTGDNGQAKAGTFIASARLHLVARSRGNEEPLGRSGVQRRRSNRVAIRVVETRLPGEHGYRFFPAFYRHLFDTMHRTPILDQNGDATPETAFGRLVEPPPVGISLS